MPYRGPDDHGMHIDRHAGLGFRRLSIIDLGGGHQPMASADERYWIVFNGEIYNYQTLREDLITKGHSFRTHSDTEVILQLYAERGEACVHALNGMFAFAIWDSQLQELFLARDRMGVKPLYYANSGEAFVFSSEIKCIFASGTVKAELRHDSLAEYMIFRQAAGPETMFRGVRSLPPGCTLTLKSGKPSIARYWSPRPINGLVALAFEDAVAQLTELLEDSVRLRLISDVPVGTFCSGGVDSSLVTALAARRKGDAINTFSVGFDEADFDESRFAAIVSQQYGTKHHELRVGNDEFSELFPEMVWHNDEPLDFANSVHIFALSRLAKRHVTVVLTGEGSDELFGGYPRYRIPQLAATWRRVPRLLRGAVASLSRDHRLSKLERYAAMPSEDAVLFNPSYLSRQLIEELAPKLMPLRMAYREQLLKETAALELEPINRASLMDQESFLVSILHRQDKMSMAASIESRVPFMDYRIVEFANRLPVELKLRSGSGKEIVKRVARKFLPKDVVDRRKSGFGVPLARWFRADTGLGARLRSLPESPAADVFDRMVLKRLVAEHRSGTDHSEALWTALNLVTWREKFHC
jgi:asparagine synthase (glutamine-hydrolysing)